MDLWKSHISSAVSDAHNSRLSVNLIAKVIACHRTEGKFFDVLAGTVPTTIVGTTHTLASLASIAVEALAFTSRAITDTLTGALSVLVKSAIVVRSVYPSNLFDQKNTDTWDAKQNKKEEASDSVHALINKTESHAKYES